jgi:hypothetical protein
MSFSATPYPVAAEVRRRELFQLQPAGWKTHYPYLKYIEKNGGGQTSFVLSA